MKRKVQVIAVFAMMVILMSCSKDNGVPSEENPIKYTVNGRVEKGPFISGSTISLQPLDKNLSPIGSIYTTKIKDDDGAFMFSTQSFTSPYALLSAEGYFFNEVKGKLSNSTLHLEAIVDLSDNSTININLLTHLKADRIKKLKLSGLSFKEANIQAQKELLTNFGLQRYTNIDASKFTITAGTEESGALIVVSSAFLLDRSEAQLTEFLSKTNQDFAEEGQLSDEFKSDYRTNCLNLKLDKISNNIQERYRSLHKEVSIMELDYFIDWDNDGIAGNEIGKGKEVHLSFEKDTLFVPREGGTFSVKVNANIPFTNKTREPLDHKTSEDLMIFDIGESIYSETIDQQEIKIKIEPASSYIMRPSYVSVFSYNEKYSAKLIIIQNGDKNKSILTKRGMSYINGILSSVSRAIYDMHVMEALYTNTYSASYAYSDIRDFETHSLNSNNYIVSDTWSAAYSALATIKNLRRIFLTQSNDDSSITSFSFIAAALYYEMAILWEKIAYIDNNDISSMTYNVTQMDSKTLFNLLETNLINQIDRFEDKRNSFKNAMDYILCSKDFPRIVLAKILLSKKEYSKAKTLLEKVTESNYYQISPSRQSAIQVNSSEMIWGYPNNVQNIYGGIQLDTFLPFATYTEVLLSLAECEYHLGNTNKAFIYLNQVQSKRNQKTTSSDFLNSLKEIWANELKGTGTYFAFLKRNNIAERALNIESWKLIFPIPNKEIVLNPNLVQNPGYRTL